MIKFHLTFHSPGSWAGNSPSYSAKDFLPQYNHNISPQGCPDVCLPVITRFSQVNNGLTTTKCSREFKWTQHISNGNTKINIREILLIT